MKKLSQSGFTLVETLLITIIILAIVITGLYVWHRSKNVDSQIKDLNSSKIDTYKRTTKAPKDWKVYNNNKYKLSLAHPNDWSVSTSVLNKKSGEELQNSFSHNATKIFVICLKPHDMGQWCPQQINISNQSFSESVKQYRSYVKDEYSPNYSFRYIYIDGLKALEIKYSVYGKTSPAKTYLIGANGYTYSLTTVYDEDSVDDLDFQILSAQDSLTLFESIKIKQ